MMINLYLDTLLMETQFYNTFTKKSKIAMEKVTRYYN